MSAQEENLSLWESIEKTDPTKTKAANDGRHDFTSVDAYYRLKNMTAKFGPMGKGFGLEYELQYQGNLVILDGTFWYDDGGKAEFRISNAQKVQFKSGAWDPDALKKLITNTYTKAWSYIGGNADVHLGKFEDDSYLAELREEQRVAAQRGPGDGKSRSLDYKAAVHSRHWLDVVREMESASWDDDWSEELVGVGRYVVERVDQDTGEVFDQEMRKLTWAQVIASPIDSQVMEYIRWLLVNAPIPDKEEHRARTVQSLARAKAVVMKRDLESDLGLDTPF